MKGKEPLDAAGKKACPRCHALGEHDHDECIERLKGQAKFWEDWRNLEHRTVHDLEDALAEVRQALSHFGGHMRSCYSHGGRSCNCGWEAARNLFKAEVE